MLISLLVLSPNQIKIWVNHGSMYRGPMTLLEPLVVLIGRHKDMLVKKSQTRTGRGGEVGFRGKEGKVKEDCWRFKDCVVR